MASGRASRAVGVQRFLSGNVRGDGLPQFLVVEPRQVAEEQRAVDAGGTGVVQDRFFVVAPSVPHPQGDLVAAGSRTAGGKLEDEFARLARSALLQRYGLERLLGSVAEQFRTLGIDALVVAESGGAAAVEVMRPARALPGLEAVFSFHRHELAGIHELLEQLGDLLFQLWPVVLQVADKQVHQRFGVGPDAVVGTRGARQFADQEDQGAQAGTEIAVLAAVALLADDLVVFALQLAGIEEVGGNLVVDEVCRHHRAHGSRCGLSRRLEDNLQLGAQLGLGARMVGVAQHFLPEPPAGGQQRVIGHEELVVVVAGGEAGVLEMAGQFALIGVQALRDDRLLLRLLAEDGFADDALDIGIRKLHAHRKAGLKPLQAGRRVQRGLAGANEKKALVQLRCSSAPRFLADPSRAGFSRR